MKRASTFTKAQIVRAIKGAQSAGLQVTGRNHPSRRIDHHKQRGETDALSPKGPCSLMGRL